MSQATPLFPLTNDTPRVLVTGANGFVGSHLCATLLGAGYTTFAGVRRGAELSTLAKMAVGFRYGDIAKPDTLAEMVSDIDVIIHNAGVVRVKSAEMFFAINARGAENLMRAAQSAGVKRVILISSMAAAGPSGDRPRREDDPEAPISAYGRSKREGERAALAYANSMSIQILRPSGVYGPGDQAVLNFFEIAQQGLRPALGDPDRRIQMIYIDDLAQGVLAALKRQLPSGEAYFLAEERAYYYYELMEAVAQAVGKEGIRIPIPAGLFRAIGATVETIAPLFGATPRLTLDKTREILSSWWISIEKAQTHFGFVAPTTFSVGAKQAVAWYRTQGWLK